jgi:hypothetical protein
MGLLVFFSHLVVYFGVSTNYSLITFIGRALFGVFSAGLLCKDKYMKK